MIKIKLYELEKHRNETTFRPFLFAKDLFNQIGIEFVTDGKADFAFIGQASFINKKVSLEESVQQGLNFLKTVKEPYFLFDGQDAATLIGAYEVFVKSDAIYLFKNTLYKDKSNYQKKYVNGRIYWSEGGYNLNNLDKFDKIKLSHTNWLSTLKPNWFDYCTNKKYDVSAMFSFIIKDVFEHNVNQSTEYMKHRKQVFENLNPKYKIAKLENNVKLPIDEYYNRMYQSVITLAPFGFGEIAPRDLESSMLGSILLKPNMDHLETLPNIYIPNETYIDCKHDFSDLNYKIDYILNDVKNLTQFYVENMRIKYANEYNPIKLVLYYYDIFKNLEGIS